MSDDDGCCGDQSLCTEDSDVHAEGDSDRPSAAADSFAGDTYHLSKNGENEKVYFSCNKEKLFVSCRQFTETQKKRV